MKTILLLVAFAIAAPLAVAQTTNTTSDTGCPDGYSACGNACCPR